MEQRRKYTNLDALRGVAAICVVIYHCSDFLGPSTVLPSAYLAVDFFFVLSGFVVAYAYDARLRDGLGLWRFAGIRLLRLYPLYLAGTLLGCFYLSMRWASAQANAAPPAEMLMRLGAALGFVPRLRDGHAIYPLDPAAWSLLYELLANFVYCGVFGWLTTRRLAWVTGLAALAVAAVALTVGSLDVGSGPAPKNFAGGAARVAFSFCVGVQILRWRTYQPAWLLRLAGYARIEVLAAVLLAAFILGPTGSARAAYDIGCTLLLFPMVILMGVHAPHRLDEQPVYTFLGRLSYPLYILHTPVLLILAGIYKAVLHAEPAAGRPLSGIVLLLGVLICCAPADRLYDTPVRRVIGRWLASRRLQATRATT